MDIQKLRVFYLAAQTGSFSEAAERLYTTQSSVTKQVQSLESELGARLFDRSHRKPELTEAGRRALPLVGKLLDDYESVLSAVREAPAGPVVYSIPVMAQYGIASLVGSFKLAHPDSGLTVSEREAREIPALLERGECDLAFLRLEQLPEGRFDSIPLFSDRLVAVVSERHPLSALERVSLAGLWGDSFLLMDRETGLFDVCTEACRRAGFSPNVGYTGKRIENILELASAGVGTALMMEKSVSYLRVSGIKIIELSEPVESTVGLAKPSGTALRPAARAFWAYTAASLSSPAPDAEAPAAPDEAGSKRKTTT